MRTDATIDGKQVVCKNAILIGDSVRCIRVGYFFTYRESTGLVRLARMLGRVAYAPALIGDKGPTKNYILAMVLSENGRFAYERWINPDDVEEAYAESPAKLAAFFFAPKLPYDAHTMRRLMEHGTVTDNYIHKHGERVAMFKARDELAKERDTNR